MNSIVETNDSTVTEARTPTQPTPTVAGSNSPSAQAALTTSNKLIKPFAWELPPNARILILTEGEKTEVNYLRGLIAAWKIPNDRITIRHPDAFDPLSLVRTAVEEVEFGSFTVERGGSGFTEAWVVFDRDSHKNFELALEYSTRHPNVHAVASSPCFELWLLHHFTPRRKAYIGSGKLLKEEQIAERVVDGLIYRCVLFTYEPSPPQTLCIADLKSKLPTYRKDLPNLYEALGGKAKLVYAMTQDLPFMKRQQAASCWTLVPFLILRLLSLRYSAEASIKAVGLASVLEAVRSEIDCSESTPNSRSVTLPAQESPPPLDLTDLAEDIAEEFEQRVGINRYT